MGAPAARDSDHVEATVFRDVVGRFTSGVTVITTALDGRRYGTTASAMSSLSMDPPMILVCLNESSETGEAVRKSGTFAVNILARGQEHLAGQFAVKGADKFAEVPIRDGILGDPVIERTLATLQCRTAETVTGGTHTVFLAVVVDAEARDLEPLTYFRGRFGQLEQAKEAEAYAGLRDWVLARHVAPGEELDLVSLSEMLHLEAEHVTTALIKLSMEGLVGRTEDGGFATTAITSEVMHGMFDARCAIEIGILDAHASSISTEQLESLEEIASELNLLVNDESPDIGAFLALSHRYHAEVVGLGNCDQLIDAFARLGISGVWRSAIADLAWWDLFDVRYHRELTAALRARSTSEAKQLVYKHNADVKRLVDDIIDAQGGQL